MTRIIPRRTPESAAMVASVQRAMAITPVLNRLTFADADQIRALFSDLIGQELDPGFSLIPPFYTTGGENIRVGRNLFVNQNCTMYDLGGITIGDDVMIGPNVSLITSGHPVAPAERRAGVTASPIVIERNVWIAAGAIVIGGVTIGENSVVAAGSVVTRDVPPHTLVGGNPARVIRAIGDGEPIPDGAGVAPPRPDWHSLADQPEASTMSDIDPRALIEAARAAANNAYAPYSNFAVGAAVLLADGSVVTGANFENASYGLSLCAETVALATVNAQGRFRDVVAIGVIGGRIGHEDTAPVSPCGRCRQIINEAAQVGGRDLPVYCGGAAGDAIAEYRLSELLPHAFGPADLGLVGDRG